MNPLVSLASKSWNFAKSQVGGWIFDTFHRYYEIEGCKFFIPQSLTTRSYRSRFLENTYEKEEISLLKYLDNSDVVLELGACLGVVSCIMNKKLIHSRKHLAVEANPALISVLKKNRQLNNALFCVENCIISKTSNGIFYIGPSLLSSSVYIKTQSKTHVPVKKLSWIKNKHKLDFTSIIMDIEGSEIEFIRENRPFFNKIRLAIIEFHPEITGQDNIKIAKDILYRCGLRKINQAGTSEAWIRSLPLNSS